MIDLYTIHSAPGIQIRVTRVPGGLLVITDTWCESGNGIALGLAQTFLPMSDYDIAAFLRECGA